jgi:Cu2+-exporting ATPase
VVPRDLVTAVAAAGAVAAGRCERCGLPAPGAARFCCYGCELAAELDAGDQGAAERARGALTLCLLLSMFVMMLSLFLYAEDVYGATADQGMARLRQLYRWAAVGLSTPVVVLCGGLLLRRALRELAAGRLTMDLLVSTGGLTAYALSVASTAAGGREVYFDSAVSALLLGTFGRYLEATARAGAGARLGSTLAGPARPVERLEGERSVVAVGAAEVRPGDRLRVAQDQALPVDATLVGGPAELDLALLTGESRPRVAQAGEVVPAGAVPVSGSLECVAVRTARESTLEQLAELSRSLRDRRAGVQRWADRFAAVLSPLVWALAVTAVAYWTAREGVGRGVVVGLAVLLAACPCTYGVAVPLTLWLALRRALEEGVLIRSAETLESLAKVRMVAFDKTGTLTEAVPRLAAVRLEPGAGVSREEALALAAGLAAGSRHPLARAIVEAAPGTAAPVVGVRSLPGLGVEGRDQEGRPVALGAPGLLRRHGAGVQDGPRVLLGREGRVLAELEVEETLRPEAAAAVEALREQGVGSAVLSGDPARGGLGVVSGLGIRAEAGLAPVEKAARLSALAAEHGPTAMVGDGLNDAPALASVGPSFAVRGGSDLARGMAEVALGEADLRLVPWTLALARRAMRVARRGLWAATAYNLLFLSLAATGRLRPVLAGLAMLTSSVLTVAVAQQVRRLPGLRARSAW